MRKLVKLLRVFTSTPPRTRNLFLHVHLVDLLSNCLLGRSLGNPSEEGDTLLGVGEVLAVDDLKLAVLLNKSDNGDTLIGERAPEDGRDHPCGLRRGYVLWSEII